jgi:hypothetical protein
VVDEGFSKFMLFRCAYSWQSLLKLLLEIECKRRDLPLPLNWFFFDSLLYCRKVIPKQTSYTLHDLYNGIMNLPILDNHSALPDAKALVGASIDLSISDCTMFDQTQRIAMMGQVVIYDAYGQRIIPPGVIRDHSTSGNTYITLGLETPIYTNPSLRAVTTGLRICTPKVGHHLSDCVAGKLDECTVTGCYNWDPDDSPIARYYDIVDDDHD